MSSAKAPTIMIEQDNSNTRHHLGGMNRRIKVVSKKDEMVYVPSSFWCALRQPETFAAFQKSALSMCEEPVPANNYDSMAQVVTSSPIRIATGEHVYTRFGFTDLLQRQAAHVVQPDITYSGGFLETKKIAALAESYYVGVAPHNCDGPLKTAIGIHLCANIPNFVILETFEDYDVT